MEGDIFTLWTQKASKRYNGILSTIRTSSNQPAWLSDTDYATYLAAWLSSSFKKRSEINRRNRLANPALHTGGSISHAEHARRLVMLNIKYTKLILEIIPS